MKIVAARLLAPRTALMASLVLAAVGCQQNSGTTQTDAREEPSPQKRLAELADRYQQASTYQDAGELRFLVDGAPEDEFRSIPFSVAIERPNKIRIHALDTMSVADGQLLRSIVQSLPGQVLVQTCPEKLSLSAIQSDELLAQAMRGQLEVELPTLLLLLGDEPLATLVRDCTASQLSDSEFQGKKCRRIALVGPAGKGVCWIEVESGLLVKYEFPLDEIRRKFPLAALWAEFRGARIDDPIDPVAFKVELPEDIKLVRRFVMPPPAAPPAPLSKPVEAFTFVALDGTAVGRDSLAGKIVVLDMWATWCGWCFEGLPLLEQVYRKYKDNDQVVFLAVSRDDLAVSNANVEQAFRKHDLTIPIVRDQEQIAERVFHLEGLPTTIVLGRDGTIQDYHIGYDAKLAETLPLKLERLLAGDNLAQQEMYAYEQEKEAYAQRLAEVLFDAADQPSGTPEVARKPGSEN
ncbi:MAG: TlpA disulfide reductase family protein [Pirellulales bacterium]